MTALADALHVVCPHCHTTNRVRVADMGHAPDCGQCHKALFDGHPLALDAATFDKHIGRSQVPVLVDFWAGWCKPCRMENPNVVAAFNKYSPKGFTVLGVSLDQPTGKERWMEAIHKDNLTWTQVSDLKYWKNEVAVMYGVNAIPQNYLIDDQGIIIGKDLRGDALNAKLAELFK